jgi:hypothetical protein
MGKVEATGLQKFAVSALLEEAHPMKVDLPDENDTFI